MSNVNELVKMTRSVRRFDESRPLASEQLRCFLDLARLGGSARNAQVLKYMIVTETGLREQVFPLLGWAGYLSDWPGPSSGERPPVYIICLLDTVLQQGGEHEAYFDLGIATQNLLLGAAEQGVYGCRIAAFSPKIHELLCLESQYKVLLVLPLGYPMEKVFLERVNPGGDILYWRDEQGGHHVPKRSLEEIMVRPPK